jgi:hypothetical protein
LRSCERKNNKIENADCKTKRKKKLMRIKPVKIRTYKEKGMNNKRDTDIRNREQVLFCEEGAGEGAKLHHINICKYNLILNIKCALGCSSICWLSALT